MSNGKSHTLTKLVEPNGHDFANAHPNIAAIVIILLCANYYSVFIDIDKHSLIF